MLDKSKRQYIIELEGWEVATLKERPRKIIFAQHISEAVITNIVDQILSLHRKL